MWRPVAAPASPAAPPWSKRRGSAVTFVSMRHTLAALRALVVLSSPPLPEGGAAAKCAIGLLRGLQAREVDYDALAPDFWSVPLDDLPEDLHIEAMPVAPPRPWHVRADRLLRPNGWLARGPYLERLRSLSAQADVVHFFDAQAAAALGEVDTPALAQIDFQTRRDRAIGMPWRRDGRIALDLLRAEHRACRRARWLLANCEEVAAELTARAPHAHVAIGPIALDERYYDPLASLDAPVAGLIGRADWPPTAKAVERLLTEVWPLVREQRPEARLLLAGVGMERSTFPDLPDAPDVEWRGRVASATDFLRELGLLLYPLTSGSGAKVKVHEALALGLPVVTTPDGAEGLGGHGGVTVSTDNERLAQATVRLISDSRARHAAGAEAHGTFLSHHKPLTAVGPVLDLYERMIFEAGHGASGP
jgi:glycosyltransferase involved in cell wall biosynthesis